MFYYIKKYPVSLVFIAIVIYLSFFRPPSDTSLSDIPHIDKVVHCGMYGVMSALLWLEFLRNHKNRRASMRYAWVGACICPILFSGMVEILQEYYTDYRGGDWMDFAANTTGAIVASLLMYHVIRPKYFKLEDDAQKENS